MCYNHNKVKVTFFNQWVWCYISLSALLYNYSQHNFLIDKFFFDFLIVRPRFTDAKIKSFMVVRAGNSARFNINFEVINK